jgi:hypothetical protein
MALPPVDALLISLWRYLCRKERAGGCQQKRAELAMPNPARLFANPIACLRRH